MIEVALASKDSCVFWPSGSGKSICYQLPALHSKKTVLVVSPLISLMTDQVLRPYCHFLAFFHSDDRVMMSLSLLLQLKHLTDKIGNTLDGRLLGCILGSANKDRGIEEAALRGDYLLVYLTPEKLSSDGFLDELAPLAKRNGILLLAVDEAHCVSEVHDHREQW